MGEVAPYIASPMDIVRGMLRVSDVKPSDVVYDLGSGDGRIVIAAVQQFKAKRAVGVELNERLVKQSREEVSRLKLEDKVEIVHEDFFNVSVEPADVVTLYLTISGNERLRPKLERELKPGTRVVSRAFRIRGWIPVKTEQVEHTTVYLYQR
ncbi:MAG: methyltransferase domain-containing protein [Nitrososphaeria archaeon]|nr:methyltransferase domain-containing protein [Nitrososphaeria archaeon]NIN52279.1 methyltransferase domain-containing protein [Nitrososphaeria archaeon]NIQ32757.1 methyltransferase domain-containing protein [Nitrososphaeria archaeon]